MLRYSIEFTMAFAAIWVLLVPVKFMKRVRTFHLPVFPGNPKYSVPGSPKFQLPGIWKNRVAARKGRKNLNDALIQAPKLWALN